MKIPDSQFHAFASSPESSVPLNEASFSDRATSVAMELMKLGVTDSHIKRLMNSYPLDRIEAQLYFLQWRKYKVAAKMIIAAVDNNYEMPAALEAKLKAEGKVGGAQ